MLLTSSFYSLYINSQYFSCLLENQPFLPKTLIVFWKIGLFLPKTLAVFWKIGLFYQRRLISFGKLALFTKDVRSKYEI